MSTRGRSVPVMFPLVRSGKIDKFPSMARVISNDLLRLKLAESLAAPIPALTPRDVRLPEVRNKAFAVIGVRRGGKTSFMQRHMADRLSAGDPPGTHLLVTLEDERLDGMTAEDLGWLLEEHRRVAAEVRERGRRTVYLDEVQLVPGWERLVRRLLDARDTEVFVSGSSSRLLSREVGSAMRGRSMEVLVHPFSFREALRHAGSEPEAEWRVSVPTSGRSWTPRSTVTSRWAAFRRRRASSRSTGSSSSAGTWTSWCCGT